jgi:ectoine hydroxylase-related dioxygenase (phytanoyl-CoA dioxygenase family)
MTLTADQRRAFEVEGYVVARGALRPADLAPVIAEYEAVIDDLARRLYAEGAIQDLYAEAAFDRRLALLTAATGQVYNQGLDISLPQAGVTKETPIHLGRAIFDFLHNERLLDLIEPLVGPEITSNPVQHVRAKVPERVVRGAKRNALWAATPWHQDSGVVLPEADASQILTVWLPLTDATEENGCLEVVPRSHADALQPHCPQADGLTIPDRYIPKERARPLPMRPGDVLLMTQLTMHCSRPNVGDTVRWSLDLRYQPTGLPTGRPAFPGFVVRSAAAPESVMRDHATWVASWLAARRRLAAEGNPTYNRWSSDAPWCA